MSLVIFSTVLFIRIVCLESRIPKDVQLDRDWTCLRTVGPFNFGTAGIVHSLITPLSTNGIGIFVVCIFDGEHLLVANNDLDQAKLLLENAGHNLTDTDL